MKWFLGRSYISYAFLILAILIKIALYLHFFQFEGDKLFQALAARNMVEGRGLTYQYVHAGDLSTEVFQPLNRWPPGYSLLIGSIYLFSRNLLISCLILDIISIIFFLIVIRKMLKQLKFPDYLTNLLILFNGVIISIYISKPTDLLAVTALLYSCYISLVFFTNPIKSPRYGLIIGTVNVLPVILRYMYLPSVIVIPGLLLWAGLKKKDNRLKMGGVYSLIVTIVLIICLFLFQKLYTGNATYVIPSDRGFYWKNILTLYPAILGAFLNLNFIEQQVSRITGVSYVAIAQGAAYLSMILFIFLSIKLTAYLVKRRLIPSSGWQFFTISTGLINISILAMLFYLSLTNSPDLQLPYNGFRWTFIGDGRFFSFLMIVLPIFAGYYLFMRPTTKYSSYKKIFQFLFIALILFETSHTVYFLLRRFKPLEYEGGNVLITLAVEEYLNRRIKESKENNLEVILTGSDETVSNWGVLKREKGLLNCSELNSHTLTAKKNSILFILIEGNRLGSFKKLINLPNVIPEKKINDLYIFSCIVKS